MMHKQSEISKAPIELEPETHINEEISLRSENRRLESEVYEYKQQLQKITKENEILTKQKEKIFSEFEVLQNAIKKENSFREQWKEKQAELSEYKQRTFTLIEDQKNWLISISEELTDLTSERDDMKEKLLKKEEALQVLLEKHHKMMNTKMMKWTGKYWKFRKKITLKNK
ncbi:hypothetical protein [Listeria valentina]|uniref:hypothetical protein n=1 Tax=Listeria valentina TaxID=2705293 RepID=UPI0014310DF5|nr:hypothetical protein [Listeria valentina]